ncbi:MAG: hypothetical protein ABR903_01830, partial [Thermodesulfovibrionales bacterium]
MKTRKTSFSVIGAPLLVLTAFSVQSDGHVEVGRGIHIPAYTFPAPPPLMVIPGTYVCFVPDIEADILFYHVSWYRPYEGRWYRARFFNGPWTFVSSARVPRVLMELPQDYRHAPPGYRRIPYTEFTRNWRRWEGNKYWERDAWWRAGRQEMRREERREEHSG